MYNATRNIYFSTLVNFNLIFKRCDREQRKKVNRLHAQSIHRQFLYSSLFWSVSFLNSNHFFILEKMLTLWVRSDIRIVISMKKYIGKYILNLRNKKLFFSSKSDFRQGSNRDTQIIPLDEA